MFSGLDSAFAPPAKQTREIKPEGVSKLISKI